MKHKRPALFDFAAALYQYSLADLWTIPSLSREEWTPANLQTRTSRQERTTETIFSWPMKDLHQTHNEIKSLGSAAVCICVCVCMFVCVVVHKHTTNRHRVYDPNKLL